MPNYQSPWTPEADDLLRQAVFQGLHARTICKQLGRTEASVRARAYVLGLSMRLVEPRRRPAGLSRRQDCQ